MSLYVTVFNSHLCSEALHRSVVGEGPHGSDYAVQRVKLQRKPTELEPSYNHSLIHLDFAHMNTSSDAHTAE